MRELLRMKQKYRKTPMNLFFIELLIVLLFMTFAGAIVLNMFVMADRKAVRSAVYEQALTDVQSFSEIYALTGDLKASADRVYGRECLTAGADGSFTAVLDEDNKPLITPEGREAYGRLTVRFSETAEETVCGRYSEVEILVFRTESKADMIIEQTCSAYIPSFAAGNGGSGDA